MSYNPDATNQGNTFNGANELLQLDSSGKIPAVSGENLTNVTASSVSNNAVTNAMLAQVGANIWKGNNTGSTANVSDNSSAALTESTSSVLTITGGTHALLNPASIQVKQANTSQSGYLSNTDWNTFNNKQTTTLASGNILIGNASNVATAMPIGGDATLSNAGILTIGNSAISNAKLATASANTWKGNNTGSTANVSDNATAALTEATSSVLTITGGNNALLNATSIQVKQSSGSQSGYLSSTDWNTFNNKAGAVNYALANGTEVATGDVWLSGQAVYRKIIPFTNITAGAAVTIDSTLTNSYCVNIIKLYGQAKVASNTRPIPFSDDSTLASNTSALCTSSGLQLELGTAIGNTNSGYVVIEYTKV